MAALDSQRVHRLARPAGESRPAVVEAGWAIGQSEARKVESHRPQPLLGERRNDSPVQKGAGRNPVDEDDRSPVALLAHEAPHASGHKAPASRLVRLDRLACRVAGAGHRRMIASVARRGIRQRAC